MKRETAGIKCGTNLFGGNIQQKKRGNKISETLRSILSEGLQKRLQQRPGGDF